MHTLLARQFALFCPAGAAPDLPGLQAVVDASYHGYEDRLQAMQRQLQALHERLQQADKMAAINGGEIYRYVTKPWADNDMLLAIRVWPQASASAAVPIAHAA